MILCNKNLIIVFLLMLVIGLLNINDSILQSNGQEKTNLSVTVTTDKPTYFPLDPIIISGKVYNETGHPTSNNIITIKVTPYDSNKIIYQTYATTRNGNYSDKGLKLGGSDIHGILQLFGGNMNAISELLSKKYNVTASTTADINGSNVIVFTPLEIKGYFLTPSAIMLYAGLADLLILLIVLAIPSKTKGNRLYTKKILVFLFISGITLSPIASLFLTDSEIGINSPIGLVKTHLQTDQENREEQWVINMGGSIQNGDISGGVQIPIYIIIFGIAGGYLRYLYDTAKNWKDDLKQRDGLTEDSHLFYSSLERLAIIFISPLLAIALWFVLFQGGTTSNYTLSAIGITVGLLMKEVVETITAFAKGIFKATKDKSRTEEVEIGDKEPAGVS
jgi:hypothetical protein